MAYSKAAPTAAMFLAVVLAGCSTAGPSVTAGPTVQAAATQAPTSAAQAVPTAQAVATQVAPTVQAVATQVAPTVQAVSTQAANAAATASTSAPVQITAIHLSTSDTTVEVRDTGSSPIDLSGWELRSGTTAVPLSSGANVAPNQPLTIHTANGTNTSGNVYLGQDVQALSQTIKPGAQLELVNPQGVTVSRTTVPSA